MSLSSRQSELFCGEDWKVIYQAFSQINFNASDPVTVNQALRSYIQANYPENFNDWIEQSEFVAIIDLLSWLAGNLAFKTDISVRENFLEVAEARESILRLARFLSYNPARNQCAVGIVKIIGVATDDDVIDSFGNNLNGTQIIWNDPDNVNWMEQFVDILNNASVTTNPYGVPLKQGTVSNIPIQLYRLNCVASKNSFGFGATVAGTAMDFEICNADFDDGGIVWERTPNSNNAFQFYYLNDGLGNTSANTGFFMLFKQGSTYQNTYTISNPVQNQLLDIPSSGVNNTDVWVQTVTDTGAVQTDWTKVPVMLDQNITYNTLPVDQRNIFSVITRDNDQISIRFSDGLYGNAPTGNISVSYRVSNGLSYTINPQDIDNIQLRLSFVNPTGTLKNVYLTFSLQSSVGSAVPAETIEQIRRRAPMVYATQNRMVSGEDYNTFPLQANLAARIKAVNRVYSGQSRYIDLHDPTGTYQDLSIFADDGIFFVEEANRYTEIYNTMNLSASEIVEGYIQPMLTSTETLNAVRDIYMSAILDSNIPAPLGMVWTQSQASLYTSTGWFNTTSSLILPGAMIKFSHNGKTQWVPVLSVSGNINTTPATNTAGPVGLSQVVPTGSTVVAILPPYVSTLPSSIISAIENKINLRLSFSLVYSYAINGCWSLAPASPSLGAPVPSAIVMLTCNFVTSLWQIYSRGLRYVFESISTVEWFDNGSRNIDEETGDVSIDTVNIMRINENLNDPSGKALRRDFSLTIEKLWFYLDGVPETRRTTVVFADTSSDGYPDDPETFYRVISDTPSNCYLFWQQGDDELDHPCYSVIGFDNEALMFQTTPVDGTEAFVMSGATTLRDEGFWTFTNGAWQQDFAKIFSFAYGRGPNIASSWTTVNGNVVPYGDQIAFHWKHYAPSNHRIDPASQNIHDIFVLTYDYDTSVRQWIASGCNGVIPTAPTELALRIAFGNLETYRMFSDAIVWRPVSYKFLFGTGADPELQMQFKVVPANSSTLSNGQIQTAVINAINAYFAVALWDFGDTFYWSELCAYIHMQLAPNLASIVPVPLDASSSFGDGFEVPCNCDEIFISTAQVSNVVIIDSNTPSNLRIR